MQFTKAQVREAHGARIPTIGLGTMTLKENVCVQAVKTALQVGYHHIDTAIIYGNEKENGEGFRASGAKREDMFITTKVRENNLTPENFQRSLDQSLANLQLPYVDLLLIHWNNKDIPFKTSVGALCKAKKDGFAKHVGVANFTTKMLDEAWAVTSEPLVCNQIEMHPFINQDKVLAACQKHGMAVVAYCPIARGKVPGADALERIGKAHGKTATQVSLRYLVQMGACPIPRTATPDHLKQNLDVFDFALSDAEMAELKKLNATSMRVVNAARAGVGYAVIRAAAAFLMLLLAVCVSSAQTKYPDPDDSKALQDCIKTAAPAGKSVDAAERCIGSVSTPCLNGDKAGSTAAMNACIDRERVVWDDILNETYRRLGKKLDASQQAKLRDTQRIWIASRDATCRFYWNYFQGTMASPMANACVNRETARRALFLLGFLLDAEGK